jgi:hypothetical protein
MTRKPTSCSRDRSASPIRSEERAGAAVREAKPIRTRKGWMRLNALVLPATALLAAIIMLAAAEERPAPGMTQTPAQPRMVLSAERLDDRIIVRVDDQTFTCYRFGAGQKYPYFYPVNGPQSGRSVTTESALPYPHHRSLFFGCDRVNGGNYWQEGNEKGQIISRGPAVTAAGPAAVQIEDTCDWHLPGQNAVLTDQREIRIEAPSRDLRIIDFAVVLTATTAIRIVKTNHALFAARVEPDLSVKSGGLLSNAGGAAAEKGTFGIPSPWCDYSGVHCGIAEGIAIFDSPQNPWFPCKWFTRDYGFFSPTPMEWLGPEGFALKQGEKLRLRYRVVVHAGDAKQAGIERLFGQWERSEKGLPPR